MDPSASPEYLRDVARSLMSFQKALLAFLAVHESGHNDWTSDTPAVVPRGGVDASTVLELRMAVARAAGRAHEAVEVADGMVGTGGDWVVDPVANWSTIADQESVLEPAQILTACEQMQGRLDAMIVKAEVMAPPEIGVAAMHPLVWGAASALWRGHHHREAVAAAAESLMGQVKATVSRFDITDTALWQEVFSDKAPAMAKPRLRWPGDADVDKDVKNMNDGLRMFAPGVQMVIRNPSIHSTEQISEQEGLEKLATLSLLARWVAVCELHQL